MLTDEQKQLRKSGIGGSDAAAVIGLNPYRTPLQVYLEKKGLLDVEENDKMLWGSLKEPLIRQEYARRNNRKVVVPEMMVSSINPFMLANVDGVTDDGRLLEIKTAEFPFGWGESGSAEIPVSYYIQVQHYLSVLELPVADVAVLIGSADYRQYEIPADDEIQSTIIEAEAVFWGNFLKDVPPDPVTYEEVKEKFGKVCRSNSVAATDDIIKRCEALKSVKKKIKELEEVEKENLAAIMKFLGENDTLVNGNSTLVTWRKDKDGVRFDEKTFAQNHPDLYSSFLVAKTGSRRFLLK